MAKAETPPITESTIAAIAELLISVFIFVFLLFGVFLKLNPGQRAPRVRCGKRAGNAGLRYSVLTGFTNICVTITRITPEDANFFLKGTRNNRFTGIKMGRKASTAERLGNVVSLYSALQREHTAAGILLVEG